MGRASFTHQLTKVSEGLLETATDLLLFQVYLTTSLIGTHTIFQVEHAVGEAHHILDEVNYKTIKSALYALTNNGCITRSKKRSSLELDITELGKKRIESLFPTYRDKRPWDGHMYLISYDIPNKTSAIRNLLRESIRRAGAALLQESLWVTPYSPQGLLSDFSKTHHLTGTIIVSKLGKDGAIGAESLSDLLVRIYHLKSVNDRYAKFIEAYGHAHLQSNLAASFAYYAILKDDPQLPLPMPCSSSFSGKNNLAKCHARA
ncbi:MAG: hypothetical protein NTY06_02180 [Candidatus Gottesmanbacteria bacterium]|nr:hypothetical protein [Candidatus Gottesmanbacteria bacterium]